MCVLVTFLKNILLLLWFETRQPIIIIFPLVRRGQEQKGSSEFAKNNFRGAILGHIHTQNCWGKCFRILEASWCQTLEDRSPTFIFEAKKCQKRSPKNDPRKSKSSKKILPCMTRVRAKGSSEFGGGKEGKKRFPGCNFITHTCGWKNVPKIWKLTNVRR